MQSWFKEKHGKQINLDAISKQEAPQLLKHFFLEIKQTTKENKGKEYEPGTLQTYPSITSLDGKFTNSSGRKTVIQALRDDFNPLEISELTGHANSESISSYSHNPLEKQRRMSIISWPVSTQARQLPTAIQVMLYGRLFSTPQPRQATQQLLVTVTAVPVVQVT